MAARQKYTVVVPFPKANGHWAEVGEELELLEVQSHALVTAGRLRLAESVPAATEKPAKNTKATTDKVE